MQFVDEFRDPELAKSLLQRLQKIMENQPHFTPENPLYLMEVCGGHTHTIFKFWDGTAYRYIVSGTTYSEFTNVATWEKNWINHKTVS